MYYETIILNKYIIFIQCDEFAAEKFIKLTHAYTILLDDASRSRYKKRNPSFGREKEEYDWNIPVSTTGTFDAVNVWLITLRSKVYLLGSKLYILGSEVFTLRTKVFTSSENLIRGRYNIFLVWLPRGMIHVLSILMVCMLTSIPKQ